MESTNEINFPLKIKEEPQEILSDVENDFFPKDMASYTHTIDFHNEVIRCDCVVNWNGEFSKKGDPSNEKVESKFESREEKPNLSFLNTPILDLETHSFSNNKSEDIAIHGKIKKEVSSGIENEFDDEIQIVFENRNEKPNIHFLNTAILDSGAHNRFSNKKSDDITIHGKFKKKVSSDIENEFDEEIQIVFETREEKPNSNFLNSAVL